MSLPERPEDAVDLVCEDGCGTVLGWLVGGDPALAGSGHICSSCAVAREEAP